MFSLARVSVFALAAALSAAGCVTQSAAPEAEAEAAATPTAPSSFEPDFELVAPEIMVDAPSPLTTGDLVRLQATFPAESKVDPGRVRTVLWDFGDGTFAVGLDTEHAYAKGGAYVVRITVEDDFDRSATTEIGLAVSERHDFSGVVAVGSRGADARPPEDEQAHDHVNHDLGVAPGASAMRVELRFADDPIACPQAPLCVAPNLVLRILDADGTKLAESASGSQPRVVEVPLEGPADLVLRVSGDTGVDVEYEVAALIEFQET